MESNITIIFIKNSGEGVGPSAWIAEKEGMALLLWCSLSLITLPSEAQAPPPPPPPPKKKRTFPNHIIHSLLVLATFVVFQRVSLFAEWALETHLLIY